MRALVAPAVSLALLALLHACSSDDAPAEAVDAGGGEASGPEAGGDVAVDGGAPSTALYVSGSRLRARTVGGADSTTRLFETFVDTKRNEPCAFVETADGTMTCLPSYVIIGFADATCTTPAAAVDTCTNTFKYAAAVSTAGTCGDEHERVAEIRPIGAVLAGATFYLRGSDGQCNAEPVNPGGEVRSVGAVIPLTELVTGTIAEEMVGSIARKRIAGADGSSLAIESFVDPVRKQPCHAASIGAISANDARCVARRTAFSDPLAGPFADDTCTTRAAGGIVPSRGCPPVSLVRRIDAVDGGDPGCGSGYESSFFELGAALPTSYRKQGDTCSLAPADRPAAAIGNAVPSTSFPAIPRTVLGAGRVRVRALTSSGVALVPGSLWDETEKLECEAAPFADGKLYCLPRARGVLAPHFKDAQCTQQVVLGKSCSDVTVAVSGDVSCTGGTYGNEVAKLGASIALAEYYDSTFGPCDGPNPNVSGVARDVVSKANASATLAEVQRVVE